MKLGIFNKEDEKPMILLSLRPGHIPGSVQLFVVDGAGNPVPSGALLTVIPDGTIWREPRMSGALGFRLDERGRVICGDY